MWHRLSVCGIFRITDLKSEPLYKQREDILQCCRNVAGNVTGKKERHDDHQSQNHHQRVILRESCLRRAQQRRHQTHDEGGDGVYESVDKVLINSAYNTAEASGQPGQTIYCSIDYLRIKSINRTRRIHCAPRDGPTVKFVDPVFVVTRYVQRAESLGPDIGKASVFHVEKHSQADPYSG